MRAASNLAQNLLLVEVGERFQGRPRSRGQRIDVFNLRSKPMFVVATVSFRHFRRVEAGSHDRFARIGGEKTSSCAIRFQISGLGDQEVNGQIYWRNAGDLLRGYKRVAVRSKFGGK